MPRISKDILLVIILLLLINGLLLARAWLDKAGKKGSLPQPAADLLLDKGAGEVLIYDIKYGRINLGKARYENKGSLDGVAAPLNVMLFETKLANFTDTEEIYSDPQTYLPVKIKRRILKWFITEEITEDYDQLNHSLTITKKTGKKEEKLIIQKKAPIHNAILLPFFIRRLPKLEPGWVFQVNLPQREYLIRLLGVEDINVGAGEFKAYHFISEPKQFNIWITTDERRIPVKIEGSGIFGYSLSLREYKEK